MEAEIGFCRDWSLPQNDPKFGAPTDRLRLVVRARSETELAMLETYAKRMGFDLDPSSGTMFIVEPPKPR